MIALLFDATLKGSLLVLLVAAIYGVVGSRVDARWRHLLWVIVLLRLAIPTAPSASWSLFNLLPAAEPIERSARAVVHAATLSPSAVAMDRVALELREPRSLIAVRWAGRIWLAGVILLGLRMVVASLRTRAAVARAVRRPASPVLVAVLKEGRRALGITGNVRIAECEVVRTPALHGVVHPVLLLPSGMGASFTAAELRHVVLHELWHLRRMDVAVSWMLALVQAVHWFNPLVWFAASRIREERELSCDELALSCLEEDERYRYGRTILKLLERFRMAAPVPALVGIVNQKRKMKRRLNMIASFQNRTRFSLLFLLLVVAVGAAGLTDGDRPTRRFMKRLDPAAAATAEKLHQRVSFQLTAGSLNDLLSAVSTSTGVPVTQAPELGTLPVQKARFTVNADNVPAHAVLMEALMPFELTAEPTASGVTITEGAGCVMVGRAHKARGKHEVDHEVIVTNGTPGQAKRVIRVLEGDAAEDDGHVDKRVFVKRIGPESCKFDESGKIHREMTFKLNENGVQSEGKMTLDISRE